MEMCWLPQWTDKEKGLWESNSWREEEEGGRRRRRRKRRKRRRRRRGERRKDGRKERGSDVSTTIHL